MGRLIADLEPPSPDTLILPIVTTGENIVVDLVNGTMRVDGKLYGNPTVFKRDGFMPCSLPAFRHYVEGGKPFIITPDTIVPTRMQLTLDHAFDGALCLGLNLLVNPSDVDGPGVPARMA